MAGPSPSPHPPHNPQNRRLGAHTWLVCSRCGMGYNPVAIARSSGLILRPGDPDPDESWSPGSVGPPCGAPLRCACFD
jgi:hypothetical protein